MSKLRLNDWNPTQESMEEHILRVAASYIRTHGKDAEIFFGEPSDQDPMTPSEFADYIEEKAGEMKEERKETEHKKNLSMEFTGTITQAGGNTEPTVTISTSQEQLKRQTNIPFFRRCDITITPI